MLKSVKSSHEYYLINCSNCFSTYILITMGATICLVLFLAITSRLMKSIIIPVQYESVKVQCKTNDIGFKVVPHCESYNELFGLIAKAFIGPANVRKWHSIKLLVDTGSSTTWVGNYNTEVYKRLRNNTIISWRDFTKKPTLLYDFDDREAEAPSQLSYKDGDSVVMIEYNNQAILFREHGTSNKLLINISLCFATEFHTHYESFAATGILGLRLSNSPLELNNVLLNRYHQQMPGSLQMISFDLRWDHSANKPLPSCFGIGQSVSQYDPQRTVIVDANPYEGWLINVQIVEVIFEKNGQWDTYSMENVDSKLDVGANKIYMPTYFVDVFSNESEKTIFTNTVFPCATIKDILPKVRIGFIGRDGRELQFGFTQQHLYHVHPNNAYYCVSALAAFGSQMALGRPFFSGAYVEMYWNDQSVLLSPKR